MQQLYMEMSLKSHNSRKALLTGLEEVEVLASLITLYSLLIIFRVEALANKWK